MAEIIVVGGGVSGLATATLLARTGFEVSLVESHQLPPPELGPDPDLRVIALSPASERILRQCGAWELMDLDRVQPWRWMRVWESAESSGVEFKTTDINEARLGHIVENGNLVRALYQAADAAGVMWLNPETASQFNPRGAGVELQLKSGSWVRANIAIAADGAFSKMRGMAKLSWKYVAHQQRAIIAEVSAELGATEAAWQRFTPRGPVALLPLFNGHYSLVWSTADAEHLIQCNDEEFEEMLSMVLGGRMGALRLFGPRHCLTLGRGFAPQWCAEGLALVGDAAHVVHPLAGLGQNLGLMDAAVLQEGVAWHPVSRRALRAYERRRKGWVWATQWTLEGFRVGFSFGIPGLDRLRSAALEYVGGNRTLRQFFINQADGRWDAPRWLREPVEMERRRESR